MHNARPLSPHLTIYKPQITSMLSIMHRLTGIALSLAYFFLATWLVAFAFAPEIYTQLLFISKTLFGQLCLIGFSFALFYHFLTGLRHLIWDIGLGFSKRAIHITGLVVIFLSLLTTVLFWGSIL